MIKEKVTIQEFVKFLNDLLEVDHDAVQALFNIRVQCNKKLAEHPTAQVMSFANGQAYYIGMVGILNGLFGIDFNKWGAIAIDIDSETGRMKKFSIIEERLPAGEKKLLAIIEKVKEIDKHIDEAENPEVIEKKELDAYDVDISDKEEEGYVQFSKDELKLLEKIYGELFHYLFITFKVKQATTLVLSKLYYAYKGPIPKAEPSK